MIITTKPSIHIKNTTPSGVCPFVTFTFSIIIPSLRDSLLEINLYFYTKNTHTMAGSFSQIYIQMVFAVRGRENLILKPWREELHKYISGIIKGKGQKPIIVNGVADHIHIFVGLKPAMAASDLVRDVKNILIF